MIHAAPASLPSPAAGSRLIRALGVAALLVLAPTAAGAQTAGGQPLEVYADDGIEWRRDEAVYIANGNAAAIQGDSEVRADRLLARYRTDASAGAESSDTGGGDIYRMEAHGNVRILLTDRTITGTDAVRDLDRKVMWLTGGNLKMESASDIVTADDSLEYWEERNLAVARGNATSRQIASRQTITADVLTAYFKDASTPKTAGSAKGKPATSKSGAGLAAPAEGSNIKVMTAVGNVVVVTPNEVIRGDEATYDPTSGQATVLGAVRITTEGEQLNGTRATVNMKTGVSRLFGDGQERARALFKPSTNGNGERKGLIGGQGGTK
ncbi:hypothetical protein CKO38_11400 [Rhodospirillum rubrum]|nr:hypothetical protein [Rhodospirillum rubrum]MBK1664996.1 hypothetical protein [Rhodospirillum rubrum]MBK1677259.1 hypothetical protein [Rhodospirillum rubrum]